MAEDFSALLIRWHAQHGRHDLPWQNTRDPYRVWLSEIMLQQTQVVTVIPYYQRFLAHFPTLEELAAAPVEEVMPLWSGLGYYARARNLHAAARAVMTLHGGVFPEAPEVIAQLPGIGRSTANAIAVVCFGARVPILDGNVKRVLCRVFGIEGVPGTAALESRLWQHAEELLPPLESLLEPVAGNLSLGGSGPNMTTYIQAQMDLGATLCTRNRPQCTVCPLEEICVARATGRTAELPQKKPRRALPERHATLLVIVHEHRVLLETRPPTGIWGGLRSLPELPPGEDATAYVEKVFGVTLIAPAQGGLRRGGSPAQTFMHVFTHFRLHITPLLCHVSLRPSAMEAGLHWLDLTALDTAALPAPVRRILAELSLYEAARRPVSAPRSTR
ncbi:adenine glycosylase [Rugosibacter aromaticivorans]|uniref:Adenine DNA glycosylase n=1 Tax=Rugosibacter aromaticivorans TaxID=1565605 RepID=A0A0C5J6X9_9PROT|nr:A/G-specific adenine glycosylase [Rugosibacter aromaticivorans]AJP47483.1 adenine glycosylase [Rugosibacter aromaticivorans]